ncbi:MAG: endonuclease III [Firmicutes bacterium]|nr:endonuclease III [Bacillota bacterium]
MDKKTRVKKVLAALDEYYPTEDKCYLHYEKPYELLIATILSAQCTDDRVNMVTKELFVKYPTLESFAQAELSQIEEDIRSTGFFRNKAKNIILSSQMLLEKYGGEMPREVEELTSLAGVGRKTANVVRSHIFSLPSIVVDTHVKRISNKLGLTEQTDPVKIEFELMKIFPKEHWIRYNTQVIAHGRKICKAQSPKCEICCLSDYCKNYEKNKRLKKND